MEQRTLVMADGTPIAYHVLGTGPGLAVVHGTMSAARHYERLIKALSPHFTVYAIDRRGRESSGPQGPGYSLETEASDLVSVLKEHSIPFLFGHSYGGLVCLQAALDYPLKRLAVYEPAITLKETPPGAWLAKFKQELSQGDDLSAFMTMAKALEALGPFERLPDPILKMLLRLFLMQPDWRERLRLMQAVEGEERAELQAYGTDRFARLSLPVLLVRGSKTNSYFKQAIEALEHTLPNVQPHVLAGFGHEAPESTAPKAVAKLLVEFFEEESTF